ncbi:hypothetical protein BS78_10G059100 [Paspalum vaginatum]|nr:hypothetical protein BS78_10G059100 [Paspalum vaginatum]
MLTLTQSWTVSAVPLSPDLDAADDGARRRYLCNLTLRDSRGVFGCCDLVASLHGLLVLEQRIGLYIVCNPTTRHWTNLLVLAPRPCYIAYPCGFYYHSSSGEYRLLCHGKEAAPSRRWQHYCYDDDEYYYYILSAGSALPRRHAPAPFPPDRRPFLVGLSYEVPVAHRGVLYWLRDHPNATRTGKMLAFRTDSETFRLMSPPPPMMTTGDVQAALLLELDDDDGALCALAMQPDGTLLEIWALQDYDDYHNNDTTSWTLRHRVVLPPPPPMPMPYPPDRFVLTGAVSAGGGTILIRGNICSRVLRLCHLKERKVKQMEMHSTPTLLPFTESLIPHDFFHKDAPRCPDLAPIKFAD